MNIDQRRVLDQIYFTIPLGFISGCKAPESSFWSAQIRKDSVDNIDVFLKKTSTFKESDLFLTSKKGKLSWLIFFVGTFGTVCASIATFYNLPFYVILLIGFVATTFLVFCTNKIEKTNLVIDAELLKSREETIRVINELNREKELLQELVENIPERIAFWDKDLKLVFCNQLFAEICDQSLNELIGKSIFFLFSKSEITRILPLFEEAQKGVAQEQECNFKLLDGTVIYLHEKFVPRVVNSKVLGVFTIAFDITKVKLIEQERIEMHSQLAEKSRLSLLGEVAGGIAHEVNNPLTVINGKTSKVLNRIMSSDHFGDVKNEIINDLEKVKETVFRISSIVKGLKNLSRDSENDPYNCTKLIEILEQSAVVHREKLKFHGIDLRIICPEKVQIYCNQIQISQIITNLVSNSFDAIKDQQEKWISIIAQENSQDNSVLIQVVDSGKGIPENVLDKIMNPFFTTKPVGQGTGLGLSISKKIIEKHGGQFYYDKTCTNTTFVIVLKSITSNIKDSVSA